MQQFKGCAYNLTIRFFVVRQRFEFPFEPLIFFPVRYNRCGGQVFSKTFNRVRTGLDENEDILFIKEVRHD